jgi:hypothetical protein
MSVPVALSALVPHIEQRGPAAFLVTTNHDRSSHLVSALVEVREGRLVVPAGRSTRRNAAALAAVTLLWAAGPDDEYSLIVDGHVTEVEDRDGGHVVVEPRAAILHRMAGRGDGPTCVPVDEAPTR